MSVGERVAKVVFIVCNAILTLLAVVLLICTSLWMMIFCIVISVIKLVIAVLGWIGLFKKNRTCLCIYAVVVLILGVISVIAAIVFLGGAAAIGITRSEEVKTLEETYGKYNTSQAAKKEIDEMHTFYKCCGADKPILINNEYPKSCCETLEGGKCLKPYEKPCADAKLDVIKKAGNIISIILLISGLMHICAGTVAATYRRYIRRAAEE